MDTFFNIFPNGIPEIDRHDGSTSDIKKLAPVGGFTQKELDGIRERRKKRSEERE
jgi:hypothetical protein